MKHKGLTANNTTSYKTSSQRWQIVWMAFVPSIQVCEQLWLFSTWTDSSVKLMWITLYPMILCVIFVQAVGPFLR